MHNEDENLEYLQRLYKRLDKRKDKLRPWRDAFLYSLVEARFKKGWSQAELGRRADVPQPAISRLERGQSNPSLKTLLKLAKALEVNLVLE